MVKSNSGKTGLAQHSVHKREVLKLVKHGKTIISSQNGYLYIDNNPSVQQVIPDCANELSIAIGSVGGAMVIAAKRMNV